MSKDKLKNSIDAKWRVHQVKVFLYFSLFILVVIILVSLFGIVSHSESLTDYFEVFIQTVGVTVLVYALFLAPFIIYYLYKYFKIINNQSEYEIYTVTLDNPTTSYFYRGAIYYTVKFTRGSGNKVTLDTKPCFSSGIFSKFPLEEYNNKKVEIIYYPDLDEIIVLGKVAS